MDELYIEVKNNFMQIETFFNKTELVSFISCPYSELYNYHFTLGAWIRNNLLNESTQLYNLFLQCGLTQKDDMSSFVIRLFYMSNIKSDTSAFH